MSGIITSGKHQWIGRETLMMILVNGMWAMSLIWHCYSARQAPLMGILWVECKQCNMAGMFFVASLLCWRHFWMGSPQQRYLKWVPCSEAHALKGISRWKFQDSCDTRDMFDACQIQKNTSQRMRVR